jgi:antitoxin Phd
MVLDGKAMRTWQVQDAKARFSELLDASLREGPQVVTRRGVEAAVVVPIEQWRRLQQLSQPTLKELLLGEGPRFDAVVPPRRSWRRRPLPELE